MGKVVKVCSVFNVSEIQPATRRSCELTRGRGPPQAQAAVVTAQEMVPSGSRSEPDPETPGTSRSNPTRLVRDEVAPVRGQPIQPSMGPSDQSVRGGVEGQARGQSSRSRSASTATVRGERRVLLNTPTVIQPMEMPAHTPREGRAARGGRGKSYSVGSSSRAAVHTGEGAQKEEG